MIPNHVGIIPDGNRRFARETGLSKAEAYRMAARKAVEVAGWCLECGVEHISAFGISQENIALRPREDVEVMHDALQEFCEAAAATPGVRVHLFGDIDGLPENIASRPWLRSFSVRIDASEARLVAHVGINYSARAEIDQALRDGCLMSAEVPPADLVLRTGGQQRMSGFLPFQTAYAELWFTDTLWPRMSRAEFEEAIAWYGRQERRMGE